MELMNVVSVVLACIALPAFAVAMFTAARGMCRAIRATCELSRPCDE